MQKFALPVTVAVGLCGARDLCTVDDILEFLDEWPAARRGPIREQVKRMCLAVYTGEATCEDAREMFVAYARLLNVLEPAAGHDFAAADKVHRSLHRSTIHGAPRAAGGLRR